MSRPFGHHPYSVSVLMNIARTEHVGARSHGRPVFVELRRMPALLLCAAVMFAIFFELGHATRSTHAAPQASYAPQPLQAVFVRAGIPDGLTAAAPIPSLSAFTTERPHRSSSHHATAAPAPVAEPAPAVSAPAVAAPVATPHETAPAPAAPVVHSAPPAASQPSSEPSSGGGGSFDSSE